MRIAFVYPPMHVAGRPLDFTNLWGDPRGTTGSEVTILAFAQEMAQRGHDVEMFIEHPNAPSYGAPLAKPVVLRDMADPLVVLELTDMSEGAPYDAVCVSLDVNVLRSVDARSVRLCLQQINGFEYGREGFDAFVDVYVSPSANHRDSLTGSGPHQWPTTRDKWHVIGNGCYPGDYLGGPKVPGRVVYTSSPDRGLHLLLDQWPEIRAAVPHAELRIFYYALEKWLSHWRGRTPDVGPAPGAKWHRFDLEHMRRSQFIDRVLPGLIRDHGVTLVGSVSRIQLARELDEAQVLAYPCNTIGSQDGGSYTEGFSVSILEGCASGALPIISDCDALGSIYEGATPVIRGPIVEHGAAVHEWTSTVIRALTDKPWANEWRAKARWRAEEYAWPKLAAQLEAVLIQQKAGK